MSYLRNATAKKLATPQTQPIPNSGQVRNNAGGYTWEVDDLVRLRRFICLGSEKGSYYVGEAKLTLQNAEAVSRLLDGGRGAEVVREVVEYSVAGRTAKQDPILFVLAMCVRCGDEETRKLAYAAVAKICRIPTFLFTFIEFAENMKAEGTGWGRGMRRTVSDWYNLRDPKDLAFQVTKYRQRNGWSHRDLLRLGHVRPVDDAHNLVYRYITKGPEILATPEALPKKVEEEFDLCDHPAPADEAVAGTLELLRVIEEVGKLTEDEQRLCELIRRFKLAREHLPTQVLGSKEVWAAMLEEMPLTAMIRNLAKMTSIGLLAGETRYAKQVEDKLLSLDQLKRARIHPFNVLVALKTYSQGRGEKGSLTWEPVPQIKRALDRAFYLSFKSVEPTGQNVVVGLDVSGSMSCHVLGSEVISCRDAAMAMSLVMARTEPSCRMMGFTNELVPLKGVSPDKDLEENLRAISGLPFGTTDCAQPMLWALKNKVKADTFIIYTDNETYAGKIHPSQALRDYRAAMNKPHAKLIVVGMAVNQFSIADPNDRGMLDIAGFDSNAPEIMRNFMLELI